MDVLRHAGPPGRSGHQKREERVAAGRSLKEHGKGYGGLRGAANLGKVK